MKISMKKGLAVVMTVALAIGLLFINPFTMEVRADDRCRTHTLTVNNGTGSGEYRKDENVTISATIPEGYVFDKWTGETRNVSDVNSATTTVRMKRDTTVTATFTAIEYDLTVNLGSGSGHYIIGTVVNVVADAAAAGQQFAGWTGDTGHVADPTSSNTNVTMPASAVSITATYVNVYDLTVISGATSGSYAEGAVVNITADAAPAGQQFAGWTGDTGYVADPTSSDTTVTMPASAVTITATYENVYDLTVNSGATSGSYAEGAIVNIAANVAPAGQQFAGWTGDIGYVADPTSSTTTVTMPASAVTVTATYDYVYPLTVVLGSGSGVYAEGAVVNIVAEAAIAGQGFAGWIGDTGYVADPTSSDTTVTMPASPVILTATYVDLYNLTVTSGTGSGAYYMGEVVNIEADAAPAGQEFAGWTGDTAYVADPTSSATTVTMPEGDVAVEATYTDVVVVTAPVVTAEVLGATRETEEEGEVLGATRTTSTSDSNYIWFVLFGISALTLTGITLAKKKEEELETQK